MDDILVKILGFLGTVIAGDAAVYDRWVWLKKHMRRGPVRTLDAGCGSGAFTIATARSGNIAIGISFDESNNAKARRRAALLGVRGCEFITENFRNLKSRARELGTFDQIICFETIEHILNDRGLVEDFFYVLNKGGVVLLTAPYRYYRLLPGDEAGLSITEDGGHVRRGYTHESIAEIFESAGFTMKKMEYVSGFLSQQLIRLNRIISRFDYRLAWAVVLPLRIVTIFDPILTPFLGYPYLSIAVIAEKEGQ